MKTDFKSPLGDLGVDHSEGRSTQNWDSFSLWGKAERGKLPQFPLLFNCQLITFIDFY